MYTIKAGCEMDNPLSNGILAQLGEHLPYKQRVIGSSPIGPISLSVSAYREFDREEIIILIWRDSSAG